MPDMHKTLTLMICCVCACLDPYHQYEAWRVIGGCPFTNPQLGAIAKAHNATAAQVCLRWVLQRGAVIASGTGADATKAKEFSAENLAIFDFSLSAAEMGVLNGISPP